jgi:hypothetical protein
MDDYTLTSPSGNSINLQEGESPVPFQGLGTTPVTVFGTNMYLKFGQFNSGALGANPLPNVACLSTSTTLVGKSGDLPFSKNTSFDITGSTAPELQFCYMPKNSESIAAIESDSDFATAKLIFESMKYN